MECDISSVCLFVYFDLGTHPVAFRACHWLCAQDYFQASLEVYMLCWDWTLVICMQGKCLTLTNVLSPQPLLKSQARQFLKNIISTLLKLFEPFSLFSLLNVLKYVYNIFWSKQWYTGLTKLIVLYFEKEEEQIIG